MSVRMDKFMYEISPISCPLKEHSIVNYVSRPLKKDRKGRKKINNSNDDSKKLVKLTPLELNDSANKSFLSYQSALASATESLLNDTNFSENNPTVDDLIASFSHLKFYDPCARTFKTPDPTSPSHIEFIFKNSDFFSNRYYIEDNSIYRK